MNIRIETVRAILESASEAWNAGSIEGVLTKYVDDLVYTTNTGGAGGESLTIRGKENLRKRFQLLMSRVSSHSRIQSVREDNGLIRTRLSAVIQHRASGHAMTLSLRQVLIFEGFRIATQEDYYDAAKLAAFWRLVAATDGQARKSASPDDALQRRGKVSQT